MTMQYEIRAFLEGYFTDVLFEKILEYWRSYDDKAITSLFEKEGLCFRAAALSIVRRSVLPNFCDREPRFAFELIKKDPQYRFLLREQEVEEIIYSTAKNRDTRFEALTDIFTAILLQSQRR